MPSTSSRVIGRGARFRLSEADGLIGLEVVVDPFRLVGEALYLGSGPACGVGAICFSLRPLPIAMHVQSVTHVAGMTVVDMQAHVSDGGDASEHPGVFGRHTE